MHLHPKIGAFFLAGESWWEAGVCDATDGPYAGFIERVEADVAEATKALARDFEVVSSGLIHAAEDAVGEARRFRDEDVDAIVFCPIIWTNDPPVVAFIQEANRVPLVMWAYSPYVGVLDNYTIPEWLRSSGPVSVQQSANIFRRFGWDYEVVFGSQQEEDTRAELGAFVRAAAAKRSLKGTRIAVLPSPCRVVIGTWMDEFRLLEKFGLELEYVSLDSYGALLEDVADDGAHEYVRHLKATYPAEGVSDGELFESARHALAFVKLAEEHGLSGIALEDFNEGFVRLFGFRPHLTHPRLSELGCTVGLEADVLGILATIIVGRLAGRMGMFNEFFTIDRYRNRVLMGHPGHGEISFGDPDTYALTRDLEVGATQKASAWLSYRAKPGAMTFLNLTPEYGKLKCAAFTGESLPGPRIMEGYSHMLVEPAGDAETLFKRIVELGLLQHWGTVHGNIALELKYMMKQLGLELTLL